MRELSHRSKNLLSIKQSMANQVARQTKGFDDFYAGFSGRLCAFGETHDLLVDSDWHGADIRELMRTGDERGETSCALRTSRCRQRSMGAGCRSVQPAFALRLERD